MIELSADLRPLLQRLNGLEQEIPFVIASTLTKTAVRVKPEIRKEMASVFDNPTRYTLNSLFVKPANKKDENPTARVWIKDSFESARGTSGFTGSTPAADYLWPQIAGGSRQLKRFEIRLRNAGILPPGMFVVPGKGAKLDRYGNLDLGQMIAVLSKLGTIREATDYGTRKRRTKYRNAKYFVSRGDSLRRGIWQHLPGGGVIAIYIFVGSVTYRQRFDFERVAKESALRFLPEEFEAAVDRVLRD